MGVLDSRRALNVLIIVVLVAFIGVAGFLGYSIWKQNNAVAESTPVSRAVKQLEAAVRKKPNDLDLRMQLAQSYTVAGMDDAAETQYKAVLKVNDKFTSAYSGLGFLTGRQRDWTASETYWRKVIALSGKDPKADMDKGLETAHFYLGTCLYEQKRYEDAAAEFKEALRLNPTASDSHYLLARTFKELDSPDNYRQELEATLSLDPMMPEANYDLGIVLLDAGDKAGAAELFRKSSDAAPARDEPRKALEDLGSASEHIAAAKQQMKDSPKKALVEARIAAAVDPRDVNAWIVFGDTYLVLKDMGKARSAYEKALSVDAGSAVAKEKLKQVKDGR
ncbi:MAG: tetratricopeptide repeat protein [Coriobacteriales bacterium]|nr:tetratricopeptide repeat protein [Coriobacteriales bacterium]